MLLAVEGGRFFSSSASGYSKGLTLLLLGRKNNEERPMRVSPWNQYQLVEQEAEPNHQLASRKSRVSRGCAAFVCFGRASAGLDGPSPPKVGPVQNILLEISISGKGDNYCMPDEKDDDKKLSEVRLKSSLKKPVYCSPVVTGGDNDDNGDSGDLGETLSEKGSGGIPDCAERRKVQWTDSFGGELVEIREFEVSDAGASDDEYEAENEQSCSCVIM